MTIRKIFVVLIGFCLILPLAARAEEISCFKLNYYENTCRYDHYTAGYEDAVTMSIMCRGAVKNNTTVTTACSSTAGSSLGATADILFRSSTVANNKYCWCKMIRSVVSKWVFAIDMGSGADCNTSCYGQCLTALATTSFSTGEDPTKLRSAMFTNIVTD